MTAPESMRKQSVFSHGGRWSENARVRTTSAKFNIAFRRFKDTFGKNRMMDSFKKKSVQLVAVAIGFMIVLPLIVVSIYQLSQGIFYYGFDYQIANCKRFHV
jgi:hypothetical protein